ncbi:MAG: glycosyl transferase, partial [Pseudomonadota bacterium]
LARGLAALAHAPRDLPILASSAMALIDGEGRPLGLTRPRRGAPPPAPGLAACLAQCPTNAPTLLMNGAARDLAVSLPLPHPLPSLDWWLVALVLGTGGRILHDTTCTVSYRQHGGNSLGEAGTWRGTGRRLALLRDGTYRRWRDALVAGLARAPLTPEAARAVAAYRAAPAAGLARHRALQSAGISRSGSATGLISLLGALTGRL